MLPPMAAPAAAAGRKRPAEDLAPGVPVAKARVAKAPVAKAPVATVPIVKAPVAKAVVGKAPLAKAAVAKAPVPKVLVAKAPIAKAQVAKAPAAKVAERAPELGAAAGVPSAGETRLPETQSASAEPPQPKPNPAESWREFEEVDPFYALIGEVAYDKVFGPDGQVRLATVDRYLHKCFMQEVIQKPEEWVELWAAMDIPVDNQAAFLAPLMSFALAKKPESLGKIIAELLRGHRVKTKSIEESVASAYKGLKDEHFNLADFLFAIFPRGPTSPWGWSRIGWGWQEWWKLVEGTLSPLEELAAFDSLIQLLERIAQEGKIPLVEQPQLWTEKRLASVRALLCKFAGFSDEGDLLACVDLDLSP